MIISSLLHLGWMAHYPIYWITYLADGILQASLGLLLGIGVLKSFISEPQAVEKMDALATRMAPKQGLLGLIAIAVGGWMIISGFIWTVG